MTLTETVAPGSLSSPSQAPASIGTASFQGVGLKYASLADWLDRVAKIGDGSGLTNVYLSTAAESFIGPTKVVNFQATSGLTSTALSARCAKAGVC
jgi:hypothetical protein